MELGSQRLPSLTYLVSDRSSERRNQFAVAQSHTLTSSQLCQARFPVSTSLILHLKKVISSTSSDLCPFYVTTCHLSFLKRDQLDSETKNFKLQSSCPVTYKSEDSVPYWCVFAGVSHINFSEQLKSTRIYLSPSDLPLFTQCHMFVYDCDIISNSGRIILLRASLLQRETFSSQGKRTLL